MMDKKRIILGLLLALVFVVGCTGLGSSGVAVAEPESTIHESAVILSPTASVAVSPPDGLPVTATLVFEEPVATPITPVSPTSTTLPTVTETEVVFEIGREITIDYLQQLEISGSEITFEEELTPKANYRQYVASYFSEGNKIYGLLTVPSVERPEGGFKAIVFNHGYIPPTAYRTTERYTAYVDYLARSGFVVFKIDYRGHGVSQGNPTGSYFSPAYTIDAIAALKSLQLLDFVDPQGIGMWGHSMAGNLVLRAMLIEPDIKAGVIWAGAVYSYDDFSKYGIQDNTYRPPEPRDDQDETARRSGSRAIFEKYGRPDTQVDFWKAVSLTENIGLLNSPLQLHHAEDDPVVSISYSYDLVSVLQENGKPYEFYTYEGGGHNLISPYFELAMQQTVEFFRKFL